MPDLTPADRAAQVVEQGLAIWQAWGASIDQFNAWQAGSETGGPNGDGKYPLTNRAGIVVLVACPAKLVSLAGDELIGEVNKAISSINDAVNQVKAQLGDIQAASDSAYAAQMYELQAKAFALAARVAVSMTFPRDFTEGSTYFTQGNGQIAQPEVGANNPLGGTFAVVQGEGQVYRTEANVETCQSFGPLGFIPGIPGTRVSVTTRARCIRNSTAATTSDVKTGVGFLPLNADFSLQRYIAGTALSNFKTSDGYQIIKDQFTVPLYGGAPYYRPTVFYNVAGNTPDPIHPSNAVQGNGQYEFSYVQCDILKPGQGGDTQLSFLYGSGTYNTPLGATALRITLVGGQGGPGGAGQPTKFGNYQASGGDAGQCGDLNIFIDKQPSPQYAFQQGYGGGLPTGRYGSIHVEAIF